MLNNHRGCAEIVGELMTPWLFFSQPWPWTIRRVAVFVDQQLGDAIDMPSSVRSQGPSENRARLKCPCRIAASLSSMGVCCSASSPRFDSLPASCRSPALFLSALLIYCAAHNK